MEPMAISNSPASPNSSPMVNPNFLPAFLMGETQTSTPRAGKLSPTKNRSVTFKTPPSGPERSFQQRLFTQPAQDTSFNMSAVHEKVGPPARGLFDTLDTSTNYASPRAVFSPRTNFTSPIHGEPKRTYASPPGNIRNLNESLNRSALHMKPSSEESLWVTVLGFPPHAVSLVLAQFALCGNIIDKKFPKEGNWVNLMYSSQYEVAKALSFNGKLISVSIMVGVIPCVAYENKENSVCENVPVTPNRARPLVQSYVPTQNTAEVLSPQNVPQRSTGFVTKAMEYVFGW